ncbi:hypothetical protein NKI38_30690 [Mesorhizobium sp. M0621]|uniref:hypothetical protein n=1 Tax=Mesorhizobium sp. M0621 TaxID=2956974 RepID=UPI00333B0C69
MKHKTEGKRLTRKLTALRQDAWRLMHAPMAAQHRWFAAVLRGHYGYYGRPHNYPAFNGFHQQVRRIWLRCLRRRSQKSRRMGWSEFETLTAGFPLPTPRITRTWARTQILRGLPSGRAGCGKSARPDLWAKAEWLSYSTRTTSMTTAVPLTAELNYLAAHDLALRWPILEVFLR